MSVKVWENPIGMALTKLQQPDICLSGKPCKALRDYLLYCYILQVTTGEILRPEVLWEVH